MKNLQRLDTNEHQFKPAQLVPVNPAPSAAEKKEPDLKDKARKHTDDALKVLTDIMSDEMAPKQARIQAATTVLERGWGKAKQEMEVTQQMNYQTLLKQIRDNENKFIEIVDVTPISDEIKGQCSSIQNEEAEPASDSGLDTRVFSEKYPINNLPKAPPAPLTLDDLI